MFAPQTLSFTPLSRMPLGMGQGGLVIDSLMYILSRLPVASLSPPLFYASLGTRLLGGSLTGTPPIPPCPKTAGFLGGSR
jgi:hypothetical protein